MKKIVFFSGGIDRSGGTERVLSLIASGLAKKDYEVVIVSMCGEKKSHYPLDEKIKIHFLEAKGFAKGILSNLRKLKGIVKSEKPDYWVDVDIILGLYTFLVRKKNKGMKWISWEHFNYYTDFPYYKGLRKFTRKLVCKKTDCLVVLSKEDEGYYKQNEKIKGKLLSIPNPSPYTVNKSSERKEEKIVLSVGRLTRIKGFDMLLEAWADVEKEFPKWKLAIVGEGEERDNLLKLKKEKNIVNADLPGFAENIEEEYKKASVYVLSSRNEGFPMVLLEAMSFSLPIVAFSCKAGVKEMVIDGYNGYLANPNDVKGLSAKIKEMLSDEEKMRKMGENSMKHVQNFDTDSILKQWVQMMDTV